MLQNDSSEEEITSIDDGSVLTNEQEVESDANEPETTSEPIPDVNVDGDRSSRKYLDAFKLNFDPFDPEDGETVECTATVHNFGNDRQIATDVNVEFWYGDKYIGTGIIEEIQPGDNGTTAVDWNAEYGSHEMRVWADPDGSDGGPDDYSVTLNVTRSDYSVGLNVVENASWIRNSQTNYYFIQVINQGSNADTFDLDFDSYKYGANPAGWTINLDDDEVALGAGESTNVELSIEYTQLNPDYTAQCVVVVTAQSQGDSERSRELYTTTDVVHDTPILYVDDDGQHDENEDGDPMLPGTFWLDWGGTYGAQTNDMINGSLNANYAGLFDYVQLSGDTKGGGWINNNAMGMSGPVYSSQTVGYNAGTYPYENDDGDDIFLEDYDAVIWNTGYCECLNANPSNDNEPASNNDNWYDQEEIAKYLDTGGNFWWMGNSINQYHDIEAPINGECTNTFAEEYFGVKNWVHAGLKPEINGVTRDPIGTGISVKNGYFYGNYVDSAERGNVAPDIEPEDHAEGVFYGAGSQYSAIRVEHPYESSSSLRYKTLISGGLESFGDWENVNDEMRIQVMENVLTWFGVPAANRDEVDVGVSMINEPFGDYINPSNAVPIVATITNFGQTDITSSFTVKVSVDEVGGSNRYSRTFTVTDDIPAGESIQIEETWSSQLPEDGKEYIFTVQAYNLNNDDNEDNDEMSVTKEARDITDIALGRMWQDWEIPWNGFLVGYDAYFYTKVANKGATEEEFDVNLVIYSPLDTVVFEKTQTLTLAPGFVETLEWIWVPRNPGGIMSGYGGAPEDLTNAYRFNISVDLADDIPNNNEGEMGVHVMHFWDGGEPIFMPADWVQVDLSNHDNHGNDDEITPWHMNENWFMSPNHAWFVANDAGERKGGWNTCIVTPEQISLKGVTDTIFNFHLSGNDETFYFEISLDYDGNTENIESASWSNIRTGSYGSEGVWVVSTGSQTLDNYMGEDFYLRVRFQTSSDARHGGYFEDFYISAVVDSYNSNDIGVAGVAIDPLIDEAEASRDIDITVQNYGENKTNSGGRPNFQVELRIEDDMGEEVYSRSQTVNDELGIGDTVVVSFNEGNGMDWMPEENGLYQIYARTIWEKAGENIDENPHNDILIVDGLVQKDFFSDDMESGANDWVVTGPSDGWELGTPVNEPIPHSGDECWGTNMQGNYPDLNGNTITLEHYVDLRTAADPILSFWHWLEVEAHEYDTAYVEVRTSEQSKYTVLWENPSPERQGVPFETEEWQAVTLELDDFAYHEIYIRFVLETDGDTNYLGWYIDDVGVGGTTPPIHDARVVSIDYPAEGEYIPPSETIDIEVTVMNVGLNEEVIPVKCTAIRQGSSPVTYPLEDQSTGVLSPGEKAQVSFTWTLPIGTYEYELKVETDLDRDGNSENDVVTKFIWAKEIYDISILSLYADPMVQDVARARSVTAEVKNVGNILLDNKVDVTFEAMYGGEVVDTFTTTISLERDEVKQVVWEWQSFKYGSYVIRVEGEINDAAETNKDDNEIFLSGIITVETIFSDTREVNDSPYYLDHESGDFKIWDHVEEGVTFWTGDNMTDDNKAGWHIDSSGHFSRSSWYGGIPSVGRYTNNMQSYLYSEPLNLEGYTNVHLSFFTKYVIEGRQYDYVEVAITTNANDDDSWSRLMKFPEDYESHDSEREIGNEYGWLHKDIEIPDTYLDDTFYIRILLKTDNGITYRGVWIDDITIYGTTTGNHAPIARFEASIEEDNESYSRNIISNPTIDLLMIKGNYAYNNLPRPAGVKQGGIQLGTEITFDASKTFDPDADDEANDISYIWDFGDGSGTEFGKIATHAYTGDLPLEGYFVVTLKTDDEAGDFSEDTMFIWIGNKAPVADFIVTPFFDSSTKISDENDKVVNEKIDVFYGDRIIFQQQATDPENDFLTFEWEFKCKTNGYSTIETGDTVSGKVGTDFLFEGLDGNEPYPPVTDVEYEVTIFVDDGVSISELTYIIVVHPYASYEFIQQVKLGTAILEATVVLTWRGFEEEAAPQASYISLERPVFVYIDDGATSPDLNLNNRGGIGPVYDIKAVGCFLQNGEEGFISAEISIPILTTDLEEIGETFTLQNDLRLEYYDEIEKRFVLVEGSEVVPDQGIKYVVGTVDHFSLYTAIVDTVYTGTVQADLKVETIVFSREPLIDRSETEVRVWIKNVGPINARNVKVRFFDGSELIDEKTVPFIRAMDSDGVWVKAKYNVSMIASSGVSEQHQIVVNVNPLHAVKESNYNNNVGSKQLDVVAQQGSVPSFDISFIMMAAAVVAVAGLSVYTRKKRD